MKKARNILVGLIIILAIIIIPYKWISESIKWTMSAIKWVVFIDNAETGLSIIAEIIIKSLCETFIVFFAIDLGYSKKNLFVVILSIVLGFIACIAIYAIAKYIIYVLILLAICLILTFINFILDKKKNEVTE